mmetsp:Transcript_114120/g.329638  ORF Transcript_114120/g.329638 Transcript_114120/m.329638 type:complete len:238 (+) Transcript_114120:873-1586(+)
MAVLRHVRPGVHVPRSIPVVGRHQLLLAHRDHDTLPLVHVRLRRRHHLRGRRTSSRSVGHRAQDDVYDHRAAIVRLHPDLFGGLLLVVDHFPELGRASSVPLPGLAGNLHSHGLVARGLAAFRVAEQRRHVLAEAVPHSALYRCLRRRGRGIEEPQCGAGRPGDDEARRGRGRQLLRGAGDGSGGGGLRCRGGSPSVAGGARRHSRGEGAGRRDCPVAEKVASDKKDVERGGCEIGA